MKTPFCNFCLKSGILCSKCETLLRDGKVSELDVKVARILLDLEQKYPILQEITLQKTVETGSILAIVVGQGELQKVLASEGKLIREISDRTGKRIKLLEDGCDLRGFLEELFAPASILTINTVWLPDGSTETKVILSRRDARHLPSSVDILRELVWKIRGVVLRIELEWG
ncbi:hypothetical protein ISS96_03405 [Candidatus Bathyarchaeota archaeon]|nr:hypothetical protein [Candidatus Bathyarchaeota archaeon]